MPLLPWGAGGRGSSEGEGVRKRGSSVVVGPSGGGRAGVPSTGASADIRGPSDEGGDVSPAGEGPWGPLDTGGGSVMPVLPMNSGLRESLPAGGRRGLRRLLLPSGFWLPSAGPGPWGAPAPPPSGPTVPFSPSTQASSPILFPTPLRPTSSHPILTAPPPVRSQFSQA